jgi:hypothetical protein
MPFIRNSDGDIVWSSSAAGATTQKFGDSSGSDYTQINTSGQIGMFGDGRQWNDIRIVPGAFEFAGVSDPTLSDWQPGGAGATFKVWEFNNSEVFFTCQLPHEYDIGTDLKPHLHWTPRNRGVAESGNTVAWKLDYSIVDINGTFGSSTTVNLFDACDGTNHKHQVTASGTISGTSITGISAMLVCRLYRDTGDASDTWATNTSGNLPAILEFDIHYQADTAAGSDSEDSKTFPA